MPIEFRCTECNRLLRTQDETAGKKAKCPECGAILTIPKPGTPPGTPSSSPFGQVPPPSEPGPSPAAPSPSGAGPESPFAPMPPPPGGPTSPFGPGTPADVENPYASPAEYTAAGRAYVPPAGGFAPTRIEMGDVFSQTWAVFKERLGIAIGAFVVFLVVIFAASFVIAFVRSAIVLGLGDPVIGIVSGLFLQLLQFLFNTWLGIGFAICLLKIARGQEVNLGELFAGGPYLLTVIVATILFWLMLGGVVLICVALAGGVGAVFAMQQGNPFIGIGALVVGYLLALIPMIVISLMFSMYQYLIIDRDAGIIDSLALSKQITTGNKLTMFALLLVAGLVGAVLTVLTCGLGLLVVGPYISILWVVMYLMMSGQATLADRRLGPAMA